MWRTDNNFTTKFKFSDILKLYFKIKNKSHVELHFYSKFNELITIKKIYNLEFSNDSLSIKIHLVVSRIMVFFMLIIYMTVIILKNFQ